MSPSTLALTVLGATATSTGIGIAVANLATTNDESIEEKIEKLWGGIVKNIGLLTAQINTTLKNNNSDINEKSLNIMKKIPTIATTTNNIYTLNPYKNPQKMYEKLQNINQELQEILEILEKSKKIEKT